MKIWRPIEGHEERYEVSDTGLVRSFYSRWGIRKTPKILKNSNNMDGYYRVGLHLNGHQYDALVHRLVAVAFISNKENKQEVNHKDGDKKNNNVDNLEWSTRSENILHSVYVLGNKHYTGLGGDHQGAKGILKFDLYGRFSLRFGTLMEAVEDAKMPNATFRSRMRENRPVNNFVYMYEKKYLNQCGVSF